MKNKSAVKEMTILLVDDEYYLIQGLMNSTDWSLLGIDRVLCAYSAAQAMKVFSENSVDILLTDVEMPRVSGLQLIRDAAAAGYDFISILLTGHSNFNYAKEAISLKVLDYLLKPVETAELEAAVKKAVSLISSQRRMKSGARNLELTSFWRKLYTGELQPESPAIESYLEAHGLSSAVDPSMRFYYSYLRIRSSQAGDQSMPASLTEALWDLPEHGTLAVPVDQGGFMLCTPAVSEGRKYNPSHRSAQEYLDKLCAAFPDVRFILYTSDEAPLFAAPYAYELLKQYSARYSSAGNRVIYIMDPEGDYSGDKVQEGAASLQEVRSDLPLERWEERLLQGRIDDILFDIRSLAAAGGRVYSTRYLASIYYGILHCIFAAASRQQISLSDIHSRLLTQSDQAQITSSPSGLISWAQSVLRQTDEIMRQSTKDVSVLEQIRQYILAHLSDPALDRGQIAEAVHITPDYLSYVFHKESGTTLSSYITGERIKAAKKLLLTTDEGAQEIAEKVGFSGAAYFHRQFKKYTGITPNAYRQQKDAGD